MNADFSSGAQRVCFSVGIRSKLYKLIDAYSFKQTLYVLQRMTQCDIPHMTISHIASWRNALMCCLTLHAHGLHSCAASHISRTALMRCLTLRAHGLHSCVASHCALTDCTHALSHIARSRTALMCCLTLRAHGLRSCVASHCTLTDCTHVLPLRNKVEQWMTAILLFTELRSSWCIQ